jgi:recombinational DNA repair protein RecT
MNQKQAQEKIKVLAKENPGLLEDIVQIGILRQQESKLSEYLTTGKDKLWTLAADTLRLSDKERYLGRLAAAIANDEKLAPCFDTPKGKMSIAQAMQKCIELGVMPGEDAYIIPYKEGKYINGQWVEDYIANVEPKAEAYVKIMLSEPNPLFKEILHDIVYENDSITIDSGEGIVKHGVNPVKGGRGDILGVWIKFIPFGDKIPIVKYWDIDRIENIRNTKSPTWKKYIEDKQLYQDCEAQKIKNAVKQSKSGDYKLPDYYGKGRDRWVKANPTNPWITDKEQMIYKTIIKGEGKRFALIKPGLQKFIEQEDKPKVEIESEKSGIIGKTEKLLDQHLENQEIKEPQEPDETTDFFDKIEKEELNEK